MKVKVIKNITIKELVTKAGITRATFYTHYDNIYEIAEEIQDDFIQVVFHNIDNLNSKETLKTQIERIANHLKENETAKNKFILSNAFCLNKDNLLWLYKKKDIKINIEVNKMKVKVLNASSKKTTYLRCLLIHGGVGEI